MLDSADREDRLHSVSSSKIIDDVEQAWPNCSPATFQFIQMYSQNRACLEKQLPEQEGVDYFRCCSNESSPHSTSTATRATTLSILSRISIVRPSAGKTNLINRRT